MGETSETIEPEDAVIEPKDGHRRDATTAGKIRQDQARAARQELVHPHRKLLHKLFIVIATLTAIAAVCLAVGQVLAIVYESNGPIEYTLNAYLLVCCSMIFFNELRWTRLTGDSQILGHWVTRGLFYAFVAVVTLEQNDETFQASQVSQANQHAYNVSLAYIKTVAYIVMGCGGLYFVLGLFCMHRIYHRLVDDYKERLNVAKRIQKSGGTSVATPTDVEPG